MVPLALVVIFAIIIMSPFFVLRLLGYKEALMLGLFFVYSTAIYLWSFGTGLLFTALFEPSNTMHFKDYMRVMPELYSYNFWASVKYGDPYATWFWLFPLLLLDLVRVSTHYIFTYATIATWIPVLVGFFTIGCLARINLHNFISNRMTFKRKKEPSVDLFGNRNISLAEEQAEIDRFLTKARGGRFS